MVHKIIMPDLGQTTAEGRILKWLKKPGDRVARGEALFEVETDKVTMEVEASTPGYLRECLVAEGELASSGSSLAILTDDAQEMYAGAELRDTAAEARPVPTPSAAGAAAERAPARAAVTPPSTARREQRPAQSAAGTSLLDVPEYRLAMFRRMLLSRLFEERLYYLFLEGRLPGTIHQSQGQEATAVGVCFALRDGDMITSTHRPHAHAVARGIPVRELMAELFARRTGCCHGKGGSMHVGDASRGMLPAIAIVGGGIPLATGYALGFRQLKKPQVAASFFGEGAANTGIFHESLNMAAIWDLPVLFVCENNRYAASTSVDKVMKIAHVSERAAAYGIPGETVDGNDVEAVFRATARAAARARTGGGPTLLEFETYRFAGHSRSDPGHYRSAEEVAAWKRRDPIARYEARLAADGLLAPADLDGIRAELERELDDAVAFAENSPHPAPEECLNDVFA